MEIKLSEEELEKINKLLYDLPIHTLPIVNQIGEVFKNAIDKIDKVEKEEE